LQFEILNQMDAQIANIFAGAFNAAVARLIPIRSPQPHVSRTKLTIGLALDAQEESTVCPVAL